MNSNSAKNAYNSAVVVIVADPGSVKTSLGAKQIVSIRSVSGILRLFCAHAAFDMLLLGKKKALVFTNFRLTPVSVAIGSYYLEKGCPCKVL